MVLVFERNTIIQSSLKHQEIKDDRNKSLKLGFMIERMTLLIDRYAFSYNLQNQYMMYALLRFYIYYFSNYKFTCLLPSGRVAHGLEMIKKALL